MEKAIVAVKAKTALQTARPGAAVTSGRENHFCCIFHHTTVLLTLITPPIVVFYMNVSLNYFSILAPHPPIAVPQTNQLIHIYPS